MPKEMTSEEIEDRIERLNRHVADKMELYLENCQSIRKLQDTNDELLKEVEDLLVIRGEFL